MKKEREIADTSVGYQEMRAAAFIFLICVLGAAWWLLNPPSPPKRESPVVAPAPIIPPSNPQPPQPASRPEKVSLEFRSDEIAAKVIAEVGRATRPKECAFAAGAHGESRLACLLVESDVYQYQLDADLAADAFSALKKFDFKEAEDPWARTISTYRSLAKTAMGYRAAAGDRLIVLLCPKSSWNQLSLECTAFAPKTTPAQSTAPRF